VTRKNYLRTLSNRTADQIAEEEALFIEIKKLEQTERRFAKEREDLLKLLHGIDAGVASVQTDDDGPTASVLVADKKRSKRKLDGLDVDTPMTPAISLAPAQSLRKSTIVKSNAYGM
jgi:DNA methyltransferase 1-associated protein 1